MNPFYDALPNAVELRFAPQLAATGLLHEALHVATLALGDAHPQLRHASTRFLRPSDEIVKTSLLPQIQLLRDLLARYRSVLIAERDHPWDIPRPPAPWTPTEDEPF